LMPSLSDPYVYKQVMLKRCAPGAPGAQQDL
jgi:hypothetical protein